MMRYKDKHFYTTEQHIKYMLHIEKLNNAEIAHQLREHWGCKNLEIAYYLEKYNKEKKI